MTTKPRHLMRILPAISDPLPRLLKAVAVPGVGQEEVVVAAPQALREVQEGLLVLAVAAALPTAARAAVQRRRR